jgi:hypothetical protein
MWLVIDGDVKKDQIEPARLSDHQIAVDMALIRIKPFICHATKQFPWFDSRACIFL